MMRQFIQDWRRWGLPVAWWNLRFELGYAIAGLTYAEKEW